MLVESQSPDLWNPESRIQILLTRNPDPESKNVLDTYIHTLLRLPSTGLFSHN